MLQQYLPFTVLKHLIGIPFILPLLKLQQYLPFTVLKLNPSTKLPTCVRYMVATVLTVYGIETCELFFHFIFLSSHQLQQYLPFTVLKQYKAQFSALIVPSKLQQYLPFTVLKQDNEWFEYMMTLIEGCNSTYRLRY